MTASQVPYSAAAMLIGVRGRSVFVDSRGAGIGDRNHDDRRDLPRANEITGSFIGAPLAGE